MESPREEEDVVRVIRDVLAPLIRADGGELYLVRADRREVQLHLTGRYAGSPGLTLTTRRIIEPLILTVAPTARLVVTSGVLVPAGARAVAEDPGSQSGR